MAAMVIGSYSAQVGNYANNDIPYVFLAAMAVGLAMRFGLHIHPDSSGLYIVEYILVVLSVSPSNPLRIFLFF